jgi:RHS repeat-associated protein
MASQLRSHGRRAARGHLGDVLLQHDEYFPRGEVWFEERLNTDSRNAQPYLFNAKELDETGLYYYGARYYDPRQSTWISADPELKRYIEGGSAMTAYQPRNLGLYAYTWNNPVILRDPTGGCVEDFCIGEAAAVGAFLASPAGQRTVAVAGAVLTADLVRRHEITHQGRAGTASQFFGLDGLSELPGIYWLTYFGPEAIDRIGRDRFSELTGVWCQPIANGLMVELATSPSLVTPEMS